MEHTPLEGARAEGALRVTTTTIEGVYEDNTPYTLLEPTWSVTPARVEGVEQEVWSARAAPPLIGLGLLDALDDSTLMELAATQSNAEQGIAGQVARTSSGQIGRFGWKASHATLSAQHASAMWLDMGLTNATHPVEDCAPAKQCPEDDPSPGPLEVDGATTRVLDDYVALLGPPARREAPRFVLEQGSALFGSLGCSTCHVPTLRTGTRSAHVILHNQVIHPYTDLLLHDMGDALADRHSDGTPSSLAEARLWRTSPLWGIGLTRTVNQHTRFLHDGRARSIEEAILWHGGEAQRACDGFKALDASQREALITFIESL